MNVVVDDDDDDDDDDEYDNFFGAITQNMLLQGRIDKALTKRGYYTVISWSCVM